MQVAKELGYEKSRNYLRVQDLDFRSFRGHNHVYRKAFELYGLQGVYLLGTSTRKDETPIVFCCQAENDEAAREIHRRVWNQGVVPFLLVETPKTVRLYSGFRCNPQAATDRERGILEAPVEFNKIADQLAALRAEAIDTGEVWNRWPEATDTAGRVDWSLLNELEKLGGKLRDLQLDRQHANALIGKYVYLLYLRDRGILSVRKLAKWGIRREDLFGCRPTLQAFWDVTEQLDGWLNGSVFPLPRDAVRLEHLQLVANVFMGGSADGQLAFDLGLYDFSSIPIETLSVIYQQFLHASEDDRPTRGREVGAYYTPLPLVNYVLGELESRRPLEEGIRVLDPSCGSGAFLVQSYRMLIEKRLRQGPVRPKELRDLLKDHIFGVERDGDACRVAEMSLILTLLDYVTPPDLESTPQFKLPTLHDNNIFQADFFDLKSLWASKRTDFKVDWLVGNPPWVDAKQNKAEDRLALTWMRQNDRQCPTGGNQIAEAFVWHSLPLLNANGVAGLLLPAMTLFKMESTRFRARLFETVKTWCVANFANLAYVLFAGRSKVPAMALFFSPRENAEEGVPPKERILTFAPFLANQRASRAENATHRKDSWSVIVNETEMRELPATSVATGSFLPWKEAMWGSFRDGKLLQRVAKRFPPLAVFAQERELLIHEGFQLRKSESGEKTTPMPELADWLQLDFSELKECGRIFTFPSNAIHPIPEDEANVRVRGGMKGLDVSKPPHVIVDESRRFAVYSDEFIAVPARQIGIAGQVDKKDVLKAISLYLSSTFCRYHQFFETPRWGIGHSVATLDTLRNIPVALNALTDAQLREWAKLRDRLASEYVGCSPPEEVLREIDERVYDLLGLTRSERILIDDFMRWNMQMVQGKVSDDILKPPADDAMLSYLAVLKGELDAFIESGGGARHEVCALRGNGVAMVAIRIADGAPCKKPSVLRGQETTAKELERTRALLLKRHHSQWLYFERGLKIYHDGAMYVFKPLEMIHWTRRQAILDAGEIVAETLDAQNT
ncbi:MAG: N-6 DNA methylase [Kiritimatiellae bacterium]|nr:N-6 DNA methylase [Kiritimatiellia bacterium]